MYKMISQKDERTLFERLSTSRRTPKIVLKSSWQTHQQQQEDTSEIASSNVRKLSARKVEREQKEDQGNPTGDPTISHIRKLYAQDESTVEKESEFKVEIRIEGIAHDVILKDEERASKIQDVVEN